MQDDTTTWYAQREFRAELRQVRVARAWLREVFSPACLLRDDCVLVLSELLANCAEHGDGGRASVTVTHARGRVLGTLVHHTAPTARVRLPEPKLREAAEVELLAESGRGLEVVVDLCGGAVGIGQSSDRTVIHWTLFDCTCERAVPTTAE